MSDVQADTQTADLSAFPGLSRSEMKMQAFLKPSLLMGPWLRHGGYAMIHATPGVGKSWLALGIAMAVAGGGRLIEWQVNEPTRALFVDAEMLFADNQARQDALLPSIDGIDEDTLDANLFTLTKAEYLKNDATRTWPTPETDPETLFEWTRQCGARLLVLDNLRGLCEVDDENASTQWGRLHGLVQRIRTELGCAVLLVHHDDKHGNAYAGSGNLDVPLEARLHLKRDARSGPSSFRLIYEKDRHGRNQGRRVSVTLSGDADDGGLSWDVSGTGLASDTDNASMGDSRGHRIYEAALNGQYQTKDALGEAVGITNRQTRRRAIDEAIRLELVADDAEFMALMKAEPECSHVHVP